MLARERIYIHDWWLSPGTFDLYPILLLHVLTQNEHLVSELKLRRPGMDRYRLDYLLERKAKEGVKIYIIL